MQSRVLTVAASNFPCWNIFARKVSAAMQRSRARIGAYVCLSPWHRGSRRARRIVNSLVEDFDGELLYYPEICLVALDFRRVLSETVSNPQRLFQFSPRQFEELVAEIWHRFGYRYRTHKQNKRRWTGHHCHQTNRSEFAHFDRMQALPNEQQG